MSKVQNPITGRSRGKMGNAVFSKQYGHNTIRSKALTVKNPNSADQQIQRGKVKMIGQIVRQVGTILRSYLSSSLSDMPFTSWVVKTMTKNSTFVVLTGIFTWAYDTIFGGNTSFWGSNLAALTGSSKLSCSFDINVLNPIIPKTGNTVNYAIITTSGDVRGAGSATITTAAGSATFETAVNAEDPAVDGDMLVVSIQNQADLNDNLPATAYKISSSKRLNNFLLVCTVTTA
jgi:hypothetical protein